MDSYFDERIARAKLGWLFEPGDPRLRQLVTAHGPLDTLGLLASGELPVSPRTEIRHLSGSRLWQAATVAVEQAQRGAGRVVIPDDPDWPAGLCDDVDGPQPVCLWARGPAPLPQPPASITVVGARASTPYGEHVAADLAAGLVDRDRTVVSSGALGIDGAALRAVAVDGAPVAVLPCGLDRPHPAAHRQLFERLADDALLLSAWPPDAVPTRARMQANQLLLGALTGGTVVVEATIRSQALHAARHAVTLGRTGMAVPGPVTSAMSAGCHHLLRTDAQIRPVTCAADVIADTTRH